MSWFKLDDKFHSHGKVLKAGNAAIGLWIRCACWSSDHLTDGHVPAEVWPKFGRKREAVRLVDCALWLPDGEGGFIIPDYLEYNPSAQAVRLRRKRDLERKRAGQ